MVYRETDRKGWYKSSYLAIILKPDLVIVDAARALAARGPQGPGKVLKLDTVIAGTDPVGVDSYSVEFTWSIWNYSGTDVEHLMKSADMGLGEIDTSKLNILKKTL